jgi:hypothetical protein
VKINWNPYFVHRYYQPHTLPLCRRNNVVFTTGTMGGLTPVTSIDGRKIGNGERGPITAKLQEAYAALPDRTGMSTEIPVFG